MDPSYKQYEYLEGLDVIQISGFDPQILQAAQSQAQTKLEDHIRNNLTDPTVGDVIGGRKTIVKEYPVLPSSLHYRPRTTGARYGKLPGRLQQKITYAFYKDILGDATDPTSFPWSRLNKRKVTLSFEFWGHNT